MADTNAAGTNTTGTVIIAGAGPTGLMLATELGLLGVDAVVLERRERPAEASAGMAVHGRTMDTFRYRGLTELIDPDETFPWPLTPFALLWLDMAAAAPNDYTYALPQWRLEKLLAGRAGELGADVRRGHTVVGVGQDDAGVAVDVAGPGGRYQLRGDYLVGCDGADSAVRTLAGIDFPASGPDYYGLLGDMELTADTDTAFDAGVHPGGLFGAIPLGSDVLRLMTIEFGVERPAGDVPVTLEELRAGIRRITGGEPKLGKIGFMARYGGPTRLAGSYRAGRVLIAGDAAHSFFISGTQGANTGIQDSVNLGWKLAATLRGWAPPGLLDTYEAERRPVGQRMCWHANAAMALLTPYPQVAALREMVTELIGFEEVNRYLLRVPSTARYPMPGPAGLAGADGCGDAAGASDLIGAPVPDVPLAGAAGVDQVAQTLRAARGVLLDLSDGTADLGGVEAWSDRVEVVTARPTHAIPAAAVLVRPDGHVAHVDVAGTDGDGRRAALAAWFGEP